MDKDSVKLAAAGKWRDILSSACSLSGDYLNPKSHGPCPKCGGTDRYRALDDVNETGAVYCNQCHNERNGDGFATIQWIRGCSFSDAISIVSDYLGLSAPRTNGSNGQGNINGSSSSSSSGAAFDFVATIARAKGAPRDSFVAYGAEPVPSSTPTIRLPAFGPDGQRCTWFTIRLAGSDKQRKGLFTRGKPAGVFLPVNADGSPRLPQAGETWHLCEGAKDAAALHSLGKLACGLPGKSLPSKYPGLARLFAGIDVLLVLNNDRAGALGVKKTGNALESIAASVSVATLPREGADVRDVLKLPDGRELVMQALVDAASWGELKNPLGSLIEIGVDEERVVNEAVAALADRREIYQRGGMLVHVVRDVSLRDKVSRPPDAPRIVALPLPTLREKLASAADWVQPASDDLEPCHPPDWAIKAVSARGQWEGIPPITAVVETPVLRPDGSIVDQPGYDPATGVFFSPCCEFPSIHPGIGIDDAREAFDALSEVTADFPFTNEAHKAAWLASLLTPLAVHSYYGPAPLFDVDANVRGSGKGLLVKATSEIAIGREASTTTLPKTDDEFRKRITAIATAGEPVMLLDNVADVLGCASFDAALTSTVWQDRILGETKMTARLPLRTIWFATSNNAILGGDISRRLLHIRLDSREEKPELRTGFRHPNLLAWVKENRGRLTTAALTILAAYVRNGRLPQGIAPWGSYEEWSAIVREAIVWLGLPDPAETRIQFAEKADTEADLLRRVLDGWAEIDPDSEGRTVAQAVSTLGIYDHSGFYSTLRDALMEFPGAKSDSLPSNKSIGMRLRHWERRVCGGRWLESVRNESNVTAWKVVTLGDIGSRN